MKEVTKAPSIADVETGGDVEKSGPFVLPAVGKPSPFKITDLPSIWGISDEMEWLVSDLIPEASVVLLSGESGCGKSTVALALADALAHGKPFLARECKLRDVLIVDRENGPGVYRERLKRFRMQETKRLHVWGPWADPEPSGPDAIEIAKFAAETQPLIIFDSLVAFHPGSEQDASETRRYMQSYRKLTKHGATCIVIHHTGKGENTKFYRGSTDIKASVDVGLLLTSKPRLQSLELVPFKIREGIIEPIKIAFEGGQFISIADKDLDVVREVIRCQPGINRSKILSETENVISDNRVREILVRGTAEGWLQSTKGPNNSCCYTLKDPPEAGLSVFRP
jgi:hypothetical protein